MEDLYVYSKGGKSLFGVLEQQFPKVTGAIKTAAEKIGEVFRLIGALISGDALKADAILDSWGLLGDIIQGAFEGLKGIAQIMGNIKSGLHPLTGFVGLKGNPIIDEAKQNTQEKINRRKGMDGYNWQTNAMTAEQARTYREGNTTSNSRVTNVYIEQVVTPSAEDFMSGIDAQVRVGGL